MKELKKRNGGARSGSGMPLGYVTRKTRDKEALRAALRALVAKRLERLVKAQLDNAEGISHFMLRDPKTGKFERVTSEQAILNALNADPGEGSYYYIYTKDPSIQAFTDLMNRTIDKPIEQVEVHGDGWQPLFALPPGVSVSVAAMKKP